MKRIGWMALMVGALGCGGGHPKKQPEALHNQSPAPATSAPLEPTEEEARQRLAHAKADLDAMDPLMVKAVDAVADAQTEPERRSALQTLRDLQQRQADIRGRMNEAQADLQRAQRKRGEVPRECQENPLARGCS